MLGSWGEPDSFDQGGGCDCSDACGVLMGACGCLFGQGAWGCSFNQGWGRDRSDAHGVLMGVCGCSFGQGAWGCSFNQGGGGNCSAKVWGAHGCSWMLIWPMGLGVLIQPRWGRQSFGQGMGCSWVLMGICLAKVLGGAHSTKVGDTDMPRMQRRSVELEI